MTLEIEDVSQQSLEVEEVIFNSFFTDSCS